MEEEYKMAIVVRKDLKMKCGKIAGQTAHATLMAYRRQVGRDNDIAWEWIFQNQPKIVLKARSEEKIHELEEKCEDRKVNYALVRDAGRTQIEPNTLTAIGIGPDLIEKIDEIVGDLKLL
jgi:peptidyl-tRNA hydrolase, PTH2 family